MVAHHEPVAVVSNPYQPQVERSLAQQVEAGFALLLVQRLQARLLGRVVKTAPVLVVQRRLAWFVDDLQHRFAGVPAERCSQGLVARHHGLPGLGEALVIQGAVDAVAVLHVIDACARFQQGVQQQAFLHGRERVDILDLRCRNRQGVDLRLGQASQREIRRRETAGAVGQAMADQGQQLRR